MKMPMIRAWAPLVALLIAACGGGEPPVPGTGAPAGAPSTKGSFTALVSFGDSLSDLGAYSPATSLAGNGQAPFFGGKFTTNGATSAVWVEALATSLGLAVTAGEMGFAGQSVKCPAALANPAYAPTCTGWGQGGARVTDPNGIGKAGGALTVPMVTQVANHLARFGSFKASDLIVVFGGNNDVFVQSGVLGAKATAIQTDAATGKISPDEASKRLLDAQTEAQGEMKKAATELADLVKNQILAKGGKYVAVWNLPDSSLTPYGQSLPVSSRQVLTTLVDTFNLWLREGLTNQPVQLVDANASFKDVYLNPTKYGLTNNKVPACDAAKIALITGGAVTDGSSLFCNSTAGVPFNGMRDGADVNTWQFADGVHPTTGGHRVLATEAAKTLRGFGWIN
ncbi:MAG: SGNH/GDSL hydrolase family protein [Betaproteobacteria bacterium]|jgi:phospholipase/lecithinase/hemolysin